MHELIEKALENYYHEIENHELIKNGNFEYGDAILYYCLIKEAKPNKLVELGCGSSTHIASLACDNITVIDMRDDIDKLGFDKKVKIIHSKFEDVDFGFIKEFKENDIVFIDNNHTAENIEHFIKETHLKINRGVLVHFHDMNVGYASDEIRIIRELLKTDCYEILYDPDKDKLVTRYPKFRDHEGSMWVGRK
mgnify:CR=1 FL=1